MVVVVDVVGVVGLSLPPLLAAMAMMAMMMAPPISRKGAPRRAASLVPAGLPAGSGDISAAMAVLETSKAETAAADLSLIADAMAQLSAEHRAVIERSYYRGWTTTQTAADLGIAEGTVKSRLHYAVRALRLTLQELGVTR